MINQSVQAWAYSFSRGPTRVDTHMQKSSTCGISFTCSNQQLMIKNNTVHWNKTTCPIAATSTYQTDCLRHNITILPMKYNTT